MKKNKVKKSIEYKNINSILNTATFIGFFCIQNMSVKDKLFLKYSLENCGFKYKVFNSNLLSKCLLEEASSLNFFLSGSLAICYSTNNTDSYNKESLFKNIQNLLKVLKVDKNTIFLANLFKGSLNNKLFEKKVSSLTSLSENHRETLSLIQSRSSTLLKHLTRAKNDLSLILIKKK